jgi:hypothetical protein
VEQYVDDYGRNAQLLPRLERRDLFDAQRAAGHAADYGQLLEPGQRLRAGENIFRSGMPLLAQGAHCDGGNVAVVDGSGRGGEIGPAHDVQVRDGIGLTALKEQVRCFVRSTPERRSRCHQGSPRTTSTSGGKPAVCGLRASANTHTRNRQLRDNLAADSAGSADNDDAAGT